MTSWYNKKVEIAKAAVDTALRNELEIQKDRVRKELGAKMNASSTEIDNYSKQEVETRRQAIIKHADDIINNTKFSTDTDKAKKS